jgi:hypothetical protein
MITSQMRRFLVYSDLPSIEVPGLTLAKAFHVNHKLLNVCFDELSFEWFKSYLSNRAQFVVYNRKIPFEYRSFCGIGVGASAFFYLYKWHLRVKFFSLLMIAL